MFTRCILATDLSGASDQIVANLGGLLPLGAKEIIVAHCMDMPRPEGTNSGYDLGDAVHENLRHRAETRLESLRARLVLHGFQATIQILHGKPGPALAQCARESGATLIIAGSRGASLAKSIILGSSALDIVRLSPIPVLVKRIEINNHGGHRHYRLVCHNFGAHILYATDFSEPAERALPYLERILETTDGAATLLHVCKKNDPQLIKDASERLENMALHLKVIGASDVRVEVSVGEVASEILTLAMRPETSLLIMGTRGKGFVEEFLLGSESETVLRHANIHILMVPPLAAVKVPLTSGVLSRF